MCAFIIHLSFAGVPAGAAVSLGPHDSLSLPSGREEEALRGHHLQVRADSGPDVERCIQRFIQIPFSFVLGRYLDNIIANPTEDKYRKIRVNNKAFQVTMNVCVW